MKKTPSLFRRDYSGNREIYDELVPSSQWVTQHEGIATLKIDGTCCMVERGRLYKRFDRKLSKQAARLKKRGEAPTLWSIADYKQAPEGWQPCHPMPDHHSGHWPGWLEVGEGPEDKWHREAYSQSTFPDGTYELIGPKIQGNPYDLDAHELVVHGAPFDEDVPTSFDALKQWFQDHHIEGVVWHHPDGRMVKIKRRDFGLSWP